jgi:hypothetical protein
MRQLLSIFLVVTTLTATAFAQDSAAKQDSADTQSRSGYDGYGGRTEVFVTGFALFSNQSNGNGIGEQGTQAGGASAGYRFHLNASSALEGRYGFSRNSEKYSIGSGVSSIPAYLSEISGSYVYSFAKWHRVQPFLEGGGGLLVFSPGNYGGGTTTSAAASGGPANFAGYSNAFANPVYSVSSSGLTRQSKPMFVYGGGADVPTLSRLYLRLEFRDVGYKTPDFGAAIFHTNTFSFVYEPSIGVAYRF